MGTNTQGFMRGKSYKGYDSIETVQPIEFENSDKVSLKRYPYNNKINPRNTICKIMTCQTRNVLL